MAPHGDFAYRLAYVRWVRSVGRAKPETDRELAIALGVGEKWLAKWKGSAKAPEGRSEAMAIAVALQPMGISVDWLYDGKGEAPDGELWTRWTTEPSWKRAALEHGGEVAKGSKEPPGKKPQAAKRAVAAGRAPKKR